MRKVMFATIIVYCLGIALACTFPPWRLKHEDYWRYVGHSPIWSPARTYVFSNVYGAKMSKELASRKAASTAKRMKVDVPKLFLELGILSGVCGATLTTMRLLSYCKQNRPEEA